MSGIVGKNLGRGSGLITASPVAADSVSGASIVDDAIDSEHYTDGSIDNAHIADDAIDSEHYADGSIDNAHIADDAIDSEHYADGSIDNAHIADDAIDSEHYADGSIDTAHIADNQITLAKMAGGTDGNIISYDGSGDPVAIATGNDGQVLTSTGAGSPPAFEDAAGGGEDGLTNNSNTTWMTVSADEEVLMPLQPAFMASLTSTQANVTGDGTEYDITGAIWTEVKDIGGNFVNGTFTAPVAGTYVFYCNNVLGGLTTNEGRALNYIELSNRDHKNLDMGMSFDEHSEDTIAISSVIIDFMDAADTAHMKSNVTGGSQVVDQIGGAATTYFAGFLLG